VRCDIVIFIDHEEVTDKKMSAFQRDWLLTED